jgi:hypothetical protein
MVKPQVVADDEELGELPPVDGDADDPEDGRDDTEPMEGPVEDGDSDDDLPANVSVSDDEISSDEDGESWLDEQADSPDLDLGSATLVELSKDASPSDDAPNKVDYDADLLEDSADSNLDGGDEGPLDSDEELRDGDLPALDSDDGGESSDAAFLEARFGHDGPLGLAWADHPWPRVGAPLAVTGAVSIVCAGRCALVALCSEASDGVVTRPSELAYVDLEGTYGKLDASGFDGRDIEVLANDGTHRGIVAAVLQGGALATSADGGSRFVVDASGLVATECVVAVGRVWIRTDTGLLAVLAGERLESCAFPSRITAIASDSAAGVLALARDDGGHRLLATFRGDSSFTTETLPDDEGGSFGAAEEPAHVTLVARASHIAYCSRGGVARRLANGKFQHFLGWEGRVTAMAFVDDRGTLLIAAYSDIEDTTGLVRIDTAGRLSVVARIGAMRDQIVSDGRVHGLACDDARGVVWLAGGFGVAAFSMGLDS